MDSEIIQEKNWFARSWKWFVPLCGIVITFIALLVSTGVSFSDFGKAYSDTELFQKAIDKANENQSVIQSLGKLEPIDKLAIMEGNAAYSNDDNSVETTVRVTGIKGKAKMDISADKNNGKWNYKIIKIRIKKTGEEIQVL